MVRKITTVNVTAKTTVENAKVPAGTHLRCNIGAILETGRKKYPLCIGKLEGRNRALGFRQENYNSFKNVVGGRRTRKNKKQSRRNKRQHCAI